MNRIYQINTVPFLASQGISSVNQIPDCILLALKHKWKIDYIYLLSVWERTRVPLDPDNPNNAFMFGEMGDAMDKPWNAEDVIPSGFSIRSYTVAETVGGEQSLRQFKTKINAMGMKLILDFVPNHLALDHPWVVTRPSYFVHRQNGEIANGAEIYSEWGDTLQLDYTNPAMRHAYLEEIECIAPLADGFRCDMAHCVLNSVFDEQWHTSHVHGKASDLPEFWTQVRQMLGPEKLLIAEAYHQKEETMITVGFDAVYDKDRRFYDKLIKALVHKSISESDLQSYVRYTNARVIETNWGKKYMGDSVVRFLENHDEERATEVFGESLSRAVTILFEQFAQDRGFILLHDGQLRGNRIKIPVQLRRFPEEEADENILSLYEKAAHVGPSWKDNLPQEIHDAQCDWVEWR